MYPDPITPKPSQKDPRDFVEMVEELAVLVWEQRDVSNDYPAAQKSIAEEMETLKREMTDYLLAADGRKGIYAKAEHE